MPDFSRDFQNKILNYRRWEDAQLSLLGRLLLKKGIEKNNLLFNEDNLKYTTFNKPYFENKKIKFNISHSGNLVVCAITTDSEIGIDVELIKDVDIHDFKFQMTNEEWDRIHNSENTNIAFFDYWTQKESVLKAHGEGLSIALKSFEILNNQTKINQENFFLQEIKVNENYKCYLAFKNDILNPFVEPPKLLNFIK